MINLVEQSKRISLTQVVSFISCFFYIYVVFIGLTGPRWEDDIRDPYEIVTSNLANQVVYSSIFLLSFLAIVPYYKRLWQWVNEEKFIIFFLFWCGLSIIWSQDALVSSKRYIQYITTSLVFISLFLNWKDTSIIFQILKIILPIYVVYNYFVIFTNPQAIDPEFFTWRGIHVGKNILGQTAVINAIFFAYFSIKTTNIPKKIFYIIFLFLSIGLLIGSTSGTSIISFTLIVGFILLKKLNKIFTPIGLGNKAIYALVITVLLFILSLIYFAPSLMVLLFREIGKDPTFTGRTDLWLDLLVLAEHHVVLGYGYQAFWIPTSPINLFLFQKYIWLPNQAHNGYVDMIVEIGVVGLILFIILVISLIKRMKIEDNNIWATYIVFALLLNLTESTLLRPHHFSNVFFFLAIWAMSYKSIFLNTENEEGEKDEKALS